MTNKGVMAQRPPLLKHKFHQPLFRCQQYEQNPINRPPNRQHSKRIRNLPTQPTKDFRQMLPQLTEIFPQYRIQQQFHRVPQQHLQNPHASQLYSAFTADSSITPPHHQPMLQPRQVLRLSRTR